MSSSLNVASSTSSIQQATWSQGNNPFQQLSQALSSGNLSAAQQAFTALQQRAPQGGAAQTAQGSTSQTARQSAFAALGQALQSGNLSAAQQAFSQLQQAGGHHHHHHGQGGQSASAATGGDTLDISGNSGTINIEEGAQSGASSAAVPANVNITGNTGTINITG